MTTRRDFMKQGGPPFGASLLAGSALAGIPRLLSAAPGPSSHALDAFHNVADAKEFMAAALAAAKAAGAILSLSRLIGNSSALTTSTCTTATARAPAS